MARKYARIVMHNTTLVEITAAVRIAAVTDFFTDFFLLSFFSHT